MMKYLFLLLNLTVLASCGQKVVSIDKVDNGYNNLELDQKLGELLENNGGVSSFILPNSNDYSKIPQDINNPLNEDKIKLGKHLFHETALALSPKNDFLKHTYSCSSCHRVDSGFTSGKDQGFGEGGLGEGKDRIMNPLISYEGLDFQPIRVPTILNVAYQRNTLWNGQLGANHHNEGKDHLFSNNEITETNNLGFEGVESQAFAGLKVHGLVANDDVLEGSIIKNNQEYINLFTKAFPNENNPITKKNVAFAIAAYERTVFSNEAPFQKYLKGDKNILTDSEKKGAILFFGKAKCVQCHNGPSLSDGNFHALGFSDLDSNPNSIIKEIDYDEKTGRESFSQENDDLYKFKTPSLYNLKDYATFGHGSSFNTIISVLEYKNNNFVQNLSLNISDLSVFEKQLFLTDEELRYLELFLKKSLYDSNLIRYVPESNFSGFRFPNNE
jgi:cytochrome c peroxidase